MANKQGHQKETYLVAAEITVEGNDNMVGDGMINHVPKPSLLERLKDAEQQKKKRHQAHLLQRKQLRHQAQRHERERMEGR